MSDERQTPPKADGAGQDEPHPQGDREIGEAASAPAAQPRQSASDTTA